MTIYRIYPAIGIARLGDSEDFYVGPEEARGLPTLRDGSKFENKHFRDSEGNLRRQAARFRVWASTADGSAEKPVDLDDEAIQRIEWTVHIANKKASWYEFRTNAGVSGYSPDHPLRNSDVPAGQRHGLLIDAGPRTLSEPGAKVTFDAASCPEGYEGNFPTGLNRPIETLGGAEVDGDGSLLVVGGKGVSAHDGKGRSLDSFANNDGWFDDTSDGQVEARIFLTDGTVVDAEGAWVICAPPSYAPQIPPLITLFDTLDDVFVRSFGTRPEIYREGRWQSDYRPDYETEIRPIFKRATLQKWVVALPERTHDLDLDLLGEPDAAYNGMRRYYLDHLRGPDEANVLRSKATGAVLMPWLAGDNSLSSFASQPVENYLTFNRTQFFLLRQWANGDFVKGPLPGSSGGEAVSRGVLENCTGGGFSPGIEMSWLSREPRIYARTHRFRVGGEAREVSASKFRIRHRRVGDRLTLGLDFEKGLEPGDITRQMALPWQADFNQCSSQDAADVTVWWWPSQRPLHVRRRKGDGALQVEPWVGQLAEKGPDDYLTFDSSETMVEQWSKLGFIADVGGVGKELFIEVGRLLGTSDEEQSSDDEAR